MEKNNMVKLYMLRHGTVQGNLEKRFVGITDESLTDSGRAVIEEKVKAGLYPEVDLVLSSPLKRCVETAEIVYPGKKPVLLPDWAEILFGEFEYGNYIELSADPRYQEWIDSGGEMAFPGGESRAQYCERVLRGFHEVCRILKESALKNNVAAAFVHLGTIKALLSTLTDMGYFDVQAQNGCGYVLTIDTENEKLMAAEVFS